MSRTTSALDASAPSSRRDRPAEPGHRITRPTAAGDILITAPAVPR